MDRINSLAQKYHQAPWRTQRQWLGLVLLGVVIIVMVAGLYLNVTVQATTNGREIMMLTNSIEEKQRENADYETELAGLNSTDVMQKHAEKLGFQPASPEDIMYVVVPGYTPKASLNLSTISEQPPASIILPEYKQTLFDWISERILANSLGSGGQP